MSLETKSVKFTTLLDISIIMATNGTARMNHNGEQLVHVRSLGDNKSSTVFHITKYSIRDVYVGNYEHSCVKPGHLAAIQLPINIPATILCTGKQNVRNQMTCRKALKVKKGGLYILDIS